MKKLQLPTLKSIQLKMVICGGLCLLLMATALISFAIITLRATALNTAKREAQAIAEAQARMIDSEFEKALFTARTLAQSLAGMKSQGRPLDRAEVNAILRHILADNPKFLGVYTLWEPNSFDGADEYYVNTKGHDETGRFIPYWVRSGDQIIQEPLLDYEVEGIGDYYLLPKRTGQEIILDPYIYPIDGQDVLLTSLVVPILVDGQFYGIAGVDLALTFLQKLADSASIFEGTGEVMLISHNGSLAAVTGAPELIGKHMGEFHQDWEADLSAIQKGRDIIQEDQEKMKLFKPIYFGNTRTPWSVNINVPIRVIHVEATNMMWKMIGIGVLLTVLALAIFWFASGLLAKPIKRITDIAKQLAEGDLDQNVDIQEQDEVGQLAQAFRKMISYLQEMAVGARQIANGNLTGNVTPVSEHDELGHSFHRMMLNLRALVGEVADNAVNLGEASKQLAASATQAGQATSQIASTIQQVAKGTSQQSESVGHTSTSVEQMNLAIQGVAKGTQAQATGAERVATLTAQISESIEAVFGNASIQAQDSASAVTASQTSAQLVQNTIQGMEGIQTRVRLTAQKVQEMGDHSDQIGVIVETIEDIASQTNLLALNAAIEAARAGEHGKGFAVVADEVRKLAEKSASATKEISHLISQIQHTVAAAMQAMSQSSSEVERGVMLAEQAGASIGDFVKVAEDGKLSGEAIVAQTKTMSALANELVKAMENVSRVVEDNTAATKEMLAGSSEVSHAIENIARVSEENSAAVEEVSASSEEMSAQVEEVTASAQGLAEMADALRQVVAQFKLTTETVDDAQCVIGTFKQAHLKWVKRVEDMLSGGAVIQAHELTSHTECALGRWYRGRGQLEWGHLPEFKAIETPHREIHQILIRIIDSYKHARNKDMGTALMELNQASRHVITALDTLEWKIGHSSGEINITKQVFQNNPSRSHQEENSKAFQPLFSA